MRYGSHLRDVIKKSGLTQQELSDKLGVARSSISAWSNSEYPPLHAIEKVCDVIGIKLYQFFMNEEDQGGFLPPGIEPYHIEFIQSLNSLPEKERLEIWESFGRIAKTLIKKY